MREIWTALDSFKMFNRRLLGWAKLHGDRQGIADDLERRCRKDFGVAEAVAHGVRANFDAASIKVFRKRQYLRRK